MGRYNPQGPSIYLQSQSLNIDDSPTFAGTTLTSLTASLPVFSGADKSLVSKSINDTLIALGLVDVFVLKGSIDCSTNPNYPAANAGDLYTISVIGKIGGAAGLAVNVGDSAYCKVDGSAAGTQAAVGANWAIIPKNTLAILSLVDVDSSRALISSEMLGQVVKVNGAYTVSLPPSAIGMHCVIEATTAAIYSVDPNGTEVIELDGTALAAGNKITSNGTKRASIYIYCEVAGTWIARTLIPSLSDGG